MNDVLQLCADLLERFRADRAAMPIVVVAVPPLAVHHGAGWLPDPSGKIDPAHNSMPDAAEIKKVDGIVAEIAKIYAHGRMLCRTFPDGPDSLRSLPRPLPHPEGHLGSYEDATAMVRALASSQGWENYERSQYRPYSFPRSALLAAIEDRVAADAKDGHSLDADSVLRGLGTFRWRPAGSAESVTRGFLASLGSPATLIGACVLAALTRVITAASLPWMLVALVGAIVVIGLAMLVQQNLAPLSWLGFANQWFTTTTFIGPTTDDQDERRSSPRGPFYGPRRAWRIRQARARLIIRQLITAYYEQDTGAGAVERRERALQYYLLLRVHALLEDLRANHHPWYPDLRSRKRTCPPMLFLPGSDNTPGAIKLLQAISDVRSRRSETDPLLVVASSQELPTLPRTAPLQSDLAPYQQWASQLRLEQSPSRGSHWPWVLLFPLTVRQLTSDSKDWGEQPWARRTLWTIWSRWTLALAIVALVSVGFGVNSVYAGEYCGGGLFSNNPDLVLVNGQCLGIETGDSAAFVPADGGVTLNGDSSLPPGAKDAGLGINLAGLESLIDAQNRKAEASGSYVTLVYAGALTAPAGSTDPVDAVEELAGVYAWQYHIDTTLGQNVEIRIDIANDADNSLQEELMADKIADAASHDPTITGVIGLGVDTTVSQAAVREFADADLPVVDTTNSDNELPDQWNYFGLSATNSEEAEALVNRFTPSGKGEHAVVLERVTGNSGNTDPYTAQQAQAATAMLKKAGFTLPDDGAPLTYAPQSNLADNDAILNAVCPARPSVVYLAGRHQDLPELSTLLEDHANCFASSVTVLSGDDMTVTESPGTTAAPLAPQMTLYYVAQTDPANVGSDDNGSELANYLQAALGLGSTPSYSDPVFADGLLALGFDAANVLDSASIQVPGSDQPDQPLPRAEVAPKLRCPQEPFSDGATGPLGFADTRHGLDFFEAVNTSTGNAQNVTFVGHQATHVGMCAPNVAP